MAENSAISWTDHTFNPWWGCTKVGRGCDHCYAETFDKRVGGAHWGAGAPRRLVKDWTKPRKWQREAERTGLSPWVFCASMADVFDNEVPPEWRARLWDLVRETPALRWIFVTKRIGNAAKMLPADWTSGAFKHCGLMSTIVNQDEADRDIPKLLATPAAWRGLSMEPLLGPVNLTSIDLDGDSSINALAPASPADLWASDWDPEMTGTTLKEAIEGFEDWGLNYPPSTSRPQGLDWIIVGGESGPGARPMHPDWARSLRDQCAAAGVPFHFKQWGEWLDEAQATKQHCAPGLEMFDRFGQPKGDSWHPYDAADRNGGAMIRVGKKAAGRRLDGIEHNGMPIPTADTAGPRAVETEGPR